MIFQFLFIAKRNQYLPLLVCMLGFSVYIWWNINFFPYFGLEVENLTFAPLLLVAYSLRFRAVVISVLLLIGLNFVLGLAVHEVSPAIYFSRVVHLLTLWSALFLVGLIAYHKKSRVDLETNQDLALSLQQKLTKNRYCFTTALEEQPEAMFVLTYGRFNYINKAARVLLSGKSNAHMKGKLFGELVERHSLAIWDSALSNFVQMGVTEPVRFQVIQKNNKPLDVQAYFSDVGFYESGSVLVTLKDIGATQELEQLRFATQMQLEEAQAAKIEFLHNISHEVRTPLNAILGFSEVLTESLDNSTQKGFATSIHRSGKDLLSILNAILELSKLETGKIDLDYSMVNIFEMMSEIIDLFREEAVIKDLKIKSDITADVPAMLELDSLRLRQVLMNLVGNAVKFTNSGEITLKAQLGPNHSSSWVDVYFEVQDTGIGIATDKSSIIFDDFKQVDGGSNRKYNGAGLGLAVCKRLISLMHGEIRLQSTLGKGSCFTIYLPRVNLSLRHKQTAGAALQVMFFQKTVLILDDKPYNRWVLKNFLESMGMLVRESEKGEKGVRAAIDFQPDLILLDIHLPSMAGAKVVELLAKDEATYDIPILAICNESKAMASILQYLPRLSGAIARPIQIDELQLELQNLVPNIPVMKEQEGQEEEIDESDLSQVLEKVVLPLAAEMNSGNLVMKGEELSLKLKELAGKHHQSRLLRIAEKLGYITVNQNKDAALALEVEIYELFQILTVDR